MARRWIRLDVGWDDSEWLLNLTPAAQLAWVKFLCYVKTHGVKGKCRALTPAATAKRFAIPGADVGAMLNAAHADGAIETTSEGDWVVTNWAEYQETDYTAAERQRRHRKDRSRLSPLRRDNRDGPLPLSRDMDSDRDTEKKKKPSASKRWKRVPADWQPTEAHQKLANELSVDLETQAAKYRDYDFARYRTDPDRTFNNWLREAHERQQARKVMPFPRQKPAPQQYDYSDAKNTEFKGFTA